MPLTEGARKWGTTILWGGDQAITFEGSASGILLDNAQTSQIARAETDEPIVWLVQTIISAEGFQDESNDIQVNFQTQIGVGQGMAVDNHPYTLFGPNFDSITDQGFTTGQRLNISAFASGGPWTGTGTHNVRVAAFVSPWSAENAPVIAELQALREELAHERELFREMLRAFDRAATGRRVRA